MINFRVVIYVLGVLLMMLAFFMLLSLPVSIYYKDGHSIEIAMSAVITLFCGAVFWAMNRNVNKAIGRREGYLIVALGWSGVALFSSLVYQLSGLFPDSSSAIFESVSGLTTTGATVVTNIELLPESILLWRSMTQWLGGMGIIVLTVAVFPILGIGGVELFVAEAPGPTSDKIHPRIKETAKRIWMIYVGLTFLLLLILKMIGLDAFDAVNHALTTMSTGGFSTKNASIAHFDYPLLEYILTLFMFLAGINYTVIYFGLTGNLEKVWRSDELKTYVFLVLVVVGAIAVFVYNTTELTMEETVRHVSFQVVSLITTTGFVTVDYTAWSGMITLVFFMLLFSGACAGSTSGSIKLIRHLVFFKNAILELKRLLHPRAVIRNKVDGNVVAPRILMHILVFLLFYLMLFIAGTIALTYPMRTFDQTILSAAGAAATALGNVGPAIGDLGPMDNFASVPLPGKWIIMVLMLLGRLELFTILILFTPYFWREN